MKWGHDEVIVVFSQPLYKTCQRQPTTLKLCRLIVYSKFHKICKFENHVERNDVIMMSLSKPMEKQWENVNLNRTKQNIYIVQKVSMSAIQKCNFYWILGQAGENWLKNKKGTGKKQNSGCKTKCPPPHDLAISSQMTMKLVKDILWVEIFTNWHKFLMTSSSCWFHDFIKTRQVKK